MKLKIAILGSTNGNSSQGLLELCKTNQNISIELIMTDRANAGIIEKAKQNKINYVYLKRKNDEFLYNLLKLYEIDYIFLIGYMKIISPILVNRFENKIINVHPSLLPKYGGGMDLDVHQKVIDAKEEISGCTVHFVTNKLDEGPIICQKECRVDTKDKNELKQKIQKLESEALVETVLKLVENKITYESSGVSILRGENVVSYLEKNITNLKQFCSLQEDGWAFTSDGVGTKIELCSKYGYLYNAGIDLVAMCVNDIICHGAMPKYFMDYIAVEKIGNNVNQVLDGILDGCKQANCKLIGGETAEMKHVYRVNSMDIAGFCAGKIKYQMNDKIKSGDYIFGIPSSGLHSNGFSLIHEIYKNDQNVKWEELLKPTTIYVNQIKNLLEKYNIKAIANITGGGILKNLPRVLDDKEFVLENWQWPLIFKEIQNKTKLSNEEMLSTFNCGIGMVVITNEFIDNLLPIGKII